MTLVLHACTMSLKSGHWKSFGAWDCNILQYRLMHYINKLPLHKINGIMILEINVVIVIGDLIILDTLDSNLVVKKMIRDLWIESIIFNSKMNCLRQITCLTALWQAIYSASIVNEVVCSYFILFHETAPCAAMKT